MKTLQKQGDDMALTFDKTIREGRGITTETPVQMTLHGSSLTIAPIHIGMDTAELEETMTRLRPCYKTMLENLAK